MRSIGIALVLLLAGSTAATATEKPGKDDELVSQFGVAFLWSGGTRARPGADFRRASTTSNLDQALSLSWSFGNDFFYRAIVELGPNSELLIGGDILLTGGFSRNISRGTTFASGACTSGTLRHDERLEVARG